MSSELLGFWRRLVFRWQRDQLDRELAEELEFHRALKQKNGYAGLDDKTAAQFSYQQMGNMTLAKEESRDMWSFMALERLWQDVRYALRTFRKNPGFTAVAAISLALGIGGNAAVFSLVNTLLIQPLPYTEPDRLVRITEVYPKAAFVVFRDQSRTMDVAAASPGFSEFNLTGQGDAMRLFGSPTSVNLFSVLGAPVARGRSFEPGEDRPGRDAVVILSHSLWRDKFGGDPQILDRMIMLDGVGRKVIGIMPPGFSYPSARVQLWIPARLDPSIMEEYWGGEFTPLIGRLRPGANLAQARSEIPALVSQIRKMFPFPMKRDWNSGATAISLQEDMVDGVRGKLLILLSSVGIVLLIACANVASLLLSRATVRRKEIALRAALGAGRARILRQLLTESVLLSVIGGALGVFLGTTALSVVRSVLPQDIPGLAGVSIDLHVLGFAACLAVLTGLAFGLAPAISAAKIDLTESIKTGSQRYTAHGWTKLRSWLIGGELALTVVLVIAAGLLIKTLYILSQVNPGFRPEQILTIRISPNQSLCKERAACVALYDELMRRARGISGVSDVAVANTVPMDGKFGMAAIPVDVEGHPKTADFPAPMLLGGAITSGYLRMMHIPLLAGRDLTEADGPQSAGVLLISASTARHFWPGENAIGKHIKPAWDREWRTVVGVVGDVRQYNLTNSSPNWIVGSIYMPYSQAVRVDRQLPASMNLLVKTSADSSRIGNGIRRLAIDQSPNVPVSEVQTMESIVADSIANRRSTMGLFISFAAAALILAAVGIYGLVSYSVSQRTYEIGVRMAIGATKANVVAMILGQSLKVAALGIGAGIVAAVLLTRFLASLLYGVAATDPLTFLAVCVLLLGITAAASCVPAWRAAQISPTRSLRVD